MRSRQLQRLPRRATGREGRSPAAGCREAKPIGVASRVAPQHPQHPCVGAAQTLDAFDCGRLAGAVRAEQADDLPRFHVEVESSTTTRLP